MQRSRPPNSRGARNGRQVCPCQPLGREGREGEEGERGEVWYVCAWVPTTKSQRMRKLSALAVVAVRSETVDEDEILTAQRSSHRGAFVSMVRLLSAVRCPLIDINAVLCLLAL